MKLLAGCLFNATYRRAKLGVYLLFAAFFAACSDSSSTAGATSETTNGIAIRVVNAENAPLAQARVALYVAHGTDLLQAVESDSLGEARFEFAVASLDSLCGLGGCFVEAISGADSALMAWALLELPAGGLTPDPLAAACEIELLPSSSIRVRTVSAESDSLLLAAQVSLASTPYVAQLHGSEYVFAHVPAGSYTLVADSTELRVSLAAGEALDTLVSFMDASAEDSLSKEFLFEDFDDGDKVNNLVTVSKGYGWYLMSVTGVTWIFPDTAGNVVAALDSADAFEGLSLKLEYELDKNGGILLGTHLGADSTYFDLSMLTAIRIKVKGDAEFGLALEHYEEVEDNKFRKAYWKVNATDDWTEVVLHPGEESLDSASYNVPFDEVSTEIALFSLFIYSGTRLQIDEIVFEGLGIEDFAEIRQ